MKTDEQEIRELIKRWAGAVHDGDLDAVLADHTADIVMFDVPPPQQGVRGIEAYRDTWPGFFEWQAKGATFEIVELDVTAGEDVAFAWALLRCGTPAEYAAHPELRLRITFGLRKENGRWVVAHEHHSFPDMTTVPDEAVEEIRAVQGRWIEQTATGDLDGMVERIADDVVSYEHGTRLEYVGKESVREVCKAGLEAGGGADIHWSIPELTVLTRDDLAVSWGLDHITGTSPEGEPFDTWSRGTRVFRRGEQGWQMIHQHVSYPVDQETGEALRALRPER
jgi:uncharacterized protein (TIGR02246 family)